jgi:preprotein translocase subunit SecE
MTLIVCKSRNSAIHVRRTPSIEKESKWVITVPKSVEIKRQSSLVRMKQFFRDVTLELKKVHWPTRKQLLVYTGVVMAAVAVMALLVWIVDSILNFGMSRFLG